MAAGKFHWYNTAVKHIAMGSVNLEDDKIWAVILHDGYSPSTASHSAYGNFSGDIATSSGTPVPAIQLTSVAITGSGAHAVKWDAADIAGFSESGGVIPSVKYLALFHQTATAAAIALGFVDLNTDAADDSVGGTTQVNITWPAGGISKLLSNP